MYLTLFWKVYLKQTIFEPTVPLLEIFYWFEKKGTIPFVLKQQGSVVKQVLQQQYCKTSVQQQL